MNAGTLTAPSSATAVSFAESGINYYGTTGITWVGSITNGAYGANDYVAI